MLRALFSFGAHMDNSVKRPTAQDYYALFQQDPRGQAIFNQLCTLFYDGQTFDADPYKHAFNAGRREVLRYVIAQCGLSQELPTTGEDE